MDIVTRQDLKQLVASAGDAAVSIYLPVQADQPDGARETQRLKHLLQQVEHALARLGRGDKAIRQLLASAESAATADVQRRRGAKGLAIFLTGESCRTFWIPQAVEESAIVDESFYIVPLVPLLADAAPFYVLAVSQKHMRLLWGDRFSEHLVLAPHLPEDIAATLNYQRPQRMYQGHLFVTTKTGTTLRGIHGQGGASDVAKEEVLEYFRLVNQSLHPLLRDEHIPLIFAGVDYLFPIYRQANSYPHLVDEHISGNQELADEHTLYARAIAVLGPKLATAKAEAVRLCSQHAQTDPTNCELASVLVAAHQGRVETLLVDDKRRIIGNFDRATLEVHAPPRPGRHGEDLVNRAVIETLVHGGDVYLATGDEMPRTSALAAVYRYPAEPSQVAVTASRAAGSAR